jgi:hypothetical protein
MSYRLLTWIRPIVVVFIGSKKTYRWSDGRAGHQHVDNMKQIADSGQGLNSYIMTRVKNL